MEGSSGVVLTMGLREEMKENSREEWVERPFSLSYFSSSHVYLSSSSFVFRVRSLLISPLITHVFVLEKSSPDWGSTYTSFFSSFSTSFSSLTGLVFFSCISSPLLPQNLFTLSKERGEKNDDKESSSSSFLFSLRCSLFLSSSSPSFLFLFVFFLSSPSLLFLFFSFKEALVFLLFPSSSSASSLPSHDQISIRRGSEEENKELEKQRPPRPVQSIESERPLSCETRAKCSIALSSSLNLLNTSLSLMTRHPASPSRAVPRGGGARSSSSPFSPLALSSSSSFSFLHPRATKKLVEASWRVHRRKPFSCSFSLNSPPSLERKSLLPIWLSKGTVLQFLASSFSPLLLCSFLSISFFYGLSSPRSSLCFLLVCFLFFFSSYFAFFTSFSPSLSSSSFLLLLLSLLLGHLSRLLGSKRAPTGDLCKDSQKREEDKETRKEAEREDGSEKEKKEEEEEERKKIVKRREENLCLCRRERERKRGGRQVRSCSFLSFFRCFSTPAVFFLLISFSSTFSSSVSVSCNRKSFTIVDSSLRTPFSSSSSSLPLTTVSVLSILPPTFLFSPSSSSSPPLQNVASLPSFFLPQKSAADFNAAGRTETSHENLRSTPRDMQAGTRRRRRSCKPSLTFLSFPLSTTLFFFSPLSSSPHKAIHCFSSLSSSCVPLHPRSSCSPSFSSSSLMVKAFSPSLFSSSPPSHTILRPSPVSLSSPDATFLASTRFPLQQGVLPFPSSPTLSSSSISPSSLSRSSFPAFPSSTPPTPHDPILSSSSSFSLLLSKRRLLHCTAAIPFWRASHGPSGSRDGSSLLPSTQPMTEDNNDEKEEDQKSEEEARNKNKKTNGGKKGSSSFPPLPRRLLVPVEQLHGDPHLRQYKPSLINSEWALAETRPYRVVALFRPEMTVEEIKAHVGSSYVQQLHQWRCRNLRVRYRGYRRLAYLVKKQDSAHVVELTFGLVPSAVHYLHIKLNHDDRILRFMILKNPPLPRSIVKRRHLIPPEEFEELVKYAGLPEDRHDSRL